MNAREERGLVIAALCKLNRDGETWIVPSQSGGEKLYRVDAKAGTCTCPDHAEAGHKCKHLYAVEFTMKREVAADGTVTETKTITFTEKKTYKQNWPAYNAAQSVEKDRFQELLADLVRGVPEPDRSGIRGQKPHLLRDCLFSMAFKVFSTISSRRFASDLREAKRRGYVRHVMPPQKISESFLNPALTPILKQLITQSALPLRTVESDFAIDSSGFGTCRFESWYDEKYGVTRRRCRWLKCHLACGVKTNIVTAVRVMDKDSGDSPQFEPLVTETAKYFSVSEVSADKAYTSLEHFDQVAGFGGTAYLPFKSNATGGIGGLFAKMFGYFQYKQEEYLAHYHKRSNVESTFSMVKRKFGDFVRSKTDGAMLNEVLCKILCHNLCVLNQEQHELGIEPMFWKDAPKADGPQAIAC